MSNTNQQKYNFLLKGTNGKAVFLVHGITGTPSEMRYFAKGLNKDGFTVFCNTLPRHCSSLNELKKVTWQEIYGACRQDFQDLKKDHAEVFVGGLSMGALMAAHLAHEFPDEVRGIIALAPTLFYDGWATPKHMVLLMHIIWHVPLFRNMVNIREDQPYGLKDEELRWGVERFYKNADARKFSNKVLLFGSPFFPMACLYQHHLFSRIVKKELPEIKNPILIIHAREDDMTSIGNARYVLERIGSEDKSLVELDDSYHMITIDKQKDKVIAETLQFLRRL
jgi:carboxylesterase